MLRSKNVNNVIKFKLIFALTLRRKNGRNVGKFKLTFSMLRSIDDLQKVLLYYKRMK